MTERRQVLQDALAAIDRLEGRLAAEQQRRHEPLAIVGAGCRYPGGILDIEGLWRTVRDGVDAVTEVPPDRWDIDAYYSPDPQASGRMVTRRGGFLSGIDRFDAALFGISPREATSLDPQHRLLLETSLEALENAGVAADRLAGSSTGVFVGITTNDYFHYMHGIGADMTEIYTGTGTALNAASGRISFTWGLQGPCVSVDTACSSSLVAIHLACQSLRAGDSDLALAGGVNVVLLPDPMVLFSKWGMMAPDGRCKTFDAAADGFVRAEGCAMIALKRLSDAQAAGDEILAVIRGSAVNSDGRSSGLTVPNGPAQQAVVRKALENAQLGPDALDYIEAHGTGTPLGDPIEVEALGAVMNGGPRRQRPLLIGSIKTNIGHTEAASGVAGLLKVVQALRHEAIPPHRNFKTPNDRIPWGDLPIAVPTALTPWPRGERPRRAGVSAFGFSGTNAHVILEEAPPAPPAAADTGAPVLVPLSARSDAALCELAESTAAFLAARPELSLAGIARTAAAGRALHPYRAAFVAASRAELETELRAFAAGQPSAWTSRHVVRPGERPRIAFLFTGQGSQYAGMGRGLYASEPVFRAALDRCAGILASRLPRPLLEVMFAEGVGARLTETGYAQPALFSLQYALCELWRSWGIVPSFVMGHSVGEFAAACVAGAIGLEDGLALIAERGRLMQALPSGGGMAAVFAGEARLAGVLAAFRDRVSVAAVNAPEETVISGDADALADVLRRLEAEGIKGRALEVSHAFHSHRLDPMLDGLERFAAGLGFAPPRIPVVANVSGRLLAPGVAPDAAYVRRHAREPVRFADGIAALRAAGATLLVEIGPQPTLLGLAAKAEPEARWTAVPSLRRGRDDRKEICAALGALHVRGAGLDWSAVQAALPPGRAPLPTYPFQRERYWAQGGSGPRTLVPQSRGGHPLLGTRQHVPGPGAQFLAEIRRDDPPFLADHVVFGTVLLPGTAYIEAALAAARTLAGGHLELEHVAIEAPLALAADASELLHLSVEPWQRGRASFLVQSAPKGAAFDRPWRIHARGVLRRPGAVAAAPAAGPGTVAAARAECTVPVDVEAYYARLAHAGLAYGPAFRGIRTLAVGDGVAVGTLEGPAAPGGQETPWILHPAMLDAAFHLLGLALAATRPDAPDRVYLPVGMEGLCVRPAGAPLRVEALARLRPAPADAALFLADLRLEDEAGAEVATITGLQLRPVEMHALERALSFPGVSTRSYAVDWQPVARPSASHAFAAEGRIVLVGGGDGLAETLAGALGDAGAVCRSLSVSALASLSEPDLALLLRGEGDTPLAWVVDCGALDQAAASGLEAAARANYLRLLRLARAVAEVAPRAGLCLLTRGAQAAAPGETPALAQAPLLGLARAVAAERGGEAPAFRIDLDPRSPPDVRLLAQALTELSRTEPELAVRSGELLAPRLAGTDETASALPPGTREVLRFAGRGDLGALRVVREARRPPGPGEVEIAVKAAGINFRDVLNTLGMVPGARAELGAECSGIILAVGSGVGGLAPGDEVVALAEDSLATHVTAPAGMVLRKPAGVSFAEAVTVPNAFLTAAVSLIAVAGLRAGQRVLVHAAAGGVGLAALRLARRLGAEVIATAGSPEKRALVLAEGAAHAFDSRSASFADDVLRVTGGTGVDCVLNALAGDLIAAGMRVVRPGGCFVEIGKQGIWSQAEAAARAPGVRYVVVDVGQDIARDPAPVRAMFEDLLADLASGSLRPLPLRAYPLRDAQAAFRTMAAGRHVGKLVLVPPGASDVEVRGDGTYLVTGGLGGIGLATAEWLAQRGAGHLVLLGRRGPDESSREALERMRAAGAKVTALACDVADAGAVETLWRETLAGGPPLRGIVHSAGTLADAVLAEQDAERFDRVAASKVAGALNLHAASAKDPLDFFALYSSTSALFGSPGQANYAAANAFLDGLAAHRRALGLPATSIGWGAWGEVGMAARLSEAQRTRWASAGIGLLEPAEAFPRLGHALAGEPAHVAVMAMDPERFLREAGPAARALLADAAPPPAAPAAATGEARPLAALRAAATPEARRDLLLGYVRRQLAHVLGINEAALDVDMPLSDLGLDSLMAVQLRNRIEADLPLKIPLAKLLGGPSAAELAAGIDGELGAAATAPAADREEIEI
ncbi:MAG: SDR family NAD(P)-dependent oxidoreductase [Hyphomicrobiaceae bacterium]|nr:SDR family NAD(P)-dependent oxidoreductase [Hyphomicrobiaceae bacterium]